MIDIETSSTAAVPAAMKSRTSKVFPESDDDLIGPPRIARMLDIDYFTVRDLRYAGRIPPPDCTIGNRPRWYRRTIKALISTGRI